eukprot:scaffold4409_cov369-Prasinococcus_capsulatus_cf.AAC.36
MLVELVDCLWGATWTQPLVRVQRWHESWPGSVIQILLSLSGQGMLVAVRTLRQACAHHSERTLWSSAGAGHGPAAAIDTPQGNVVAA